MFDLVTEVSGHQVKELAASNIARAKQLAHVPVRPRFAFDIGFSEEVDVVRKVTAEDNDVGPNIADDICRKIGCKNIEEKRA